MSIGKKSKLRMSAVILLVVFMLSFSFAGCSKDKSGEASSTTAGTQVESTATPQATEDPFKDTIEISVGMWDISEDNTDPAKDALVDTITKKLNIKFKPVPLTWDDYQQKIQMWAAAQQLPDVFAIDMVGQPMIRNNWISQGVVKAIPDDLGKYTYLNEVMQLPDVVSLKGADGKQYCIPRNDTTKTEHSVVNEMFVYRWDWAQQLGITKEPETYDEFVNMVKLFVEKDPEGKKTAGITIHHQGFLNAFLLAYNPAYANFRGDKFSWIKEDGQFIPTFLSKKTVTGLKVIRSLYDQGLIDKDFPLIKSSEGDEKFYSGRAGVVITNTVDYDVLEKNYPDKKVSEMIKMLKIWPAEDGNRYQPANKSYWSESYFNSKIDDKKMERLLYLYDYLLSPEGKDLFRWGIEGVDYTKDGDKYTDLDESGDLRKKYTSIAALGCLASWDGDFAYDISKMPKDPEKAKRFQDKLDFISWAKDNLKVADINMPVTNMSTPLKDKFVETFSDDLVNVVLSKKSVEDAFADVIKAYDEKHLQEMITEVNAKAAELGIN